MANPQKKWDHGDPKENWLGKYLRVQQKSDAEVRRLLVRAAADASRQAEKILAAGPSTGNSVRLAQIRESEAAIRSTLSGFWKKFGDSLKANRQQAVAAAIRAGIDWDLPMLKSAGLSFGNGKSLESNLRASADRSVRLMLERVDDEEKFSLSEKVYKTKELSGGWVDRAINSAIARNLTPQEFAKEVKKFIRPDVPGGVSFAANRLARTELNNAYHLAAIRDMQGKPWIKGAEWHLSGSHPKPDKCDIYARESPFSLSDIPRKPHPFCLCYIVPGTEKPDDFVEDFINGKYDKYLKDKYGI